VKNYSLSWIKTTNAAIDESLKAMVDNLAKPTEYLLMAGDLRLNIDEINLLNKYGCRPSLDLKAFILLPLLLAFLICF
jgi:hypothetical protein